MTTQLKRADASGDARLREVKQAAAIDDREARVTRQRGDARGTQEVVRILATLADDCGLLPCTARRALQHDDVAALSVEHVDHAVQDDETTDGGKREVEPEE